MECLKNLTFTSRVFKIPKKPNFFRRNRTPCIAKTPHSPAPLWLRGHPLEPFKFILKRAPRRLPLEPPPGSALVSRCSRFYFKFGLRGFLGFLGFLAISNFEFFKSGFLGFLAISNFKFFQIRFLGFFRFFSFAHDRKHSEMWQSMPYYIAHQTTMIALLQRTIREIQ